ncbi:MAG TPA: hypothetical protein VNW95_12405 [Mucilaginibacter sp.]|jgi:hypothetical protein|nr:hypothetical protein [Mucilaginibacter sp.]
MKSRYLFPYWCRFLGYALILAHVPVVVFKQSLGFDLNHGPVNNDLLNSHHVFFMTTTLLMAIGLFIVAFSKEKIEDEQISQLRSDSLQWAIYVNYVLLIISLVFTNDTEHILFLNLMVPLAFFIIRFRWVIFRLNSSLSREG